MEVDKKQHKLKALWRVNECVGIECGWLSECARGKLTRIYLIFNAKDTQVLKR